MYESWRTRFEAKLSVVEDGTERSNWNGEDFWNLVVRDYQNGVELFIIGSECYGVSDIGFNGRKFKFIKDNKEIETPIFHVGTIPMKFSGILKNNCIMV